jgi:hypothetical protein
MTAALGGVGRLAFGSRDRLAATEGFGSCGEEGRGGGRGGGRGAEVGGFDGVVATGGTEPFGWKGGAVALSFDTRGGGGAGGSASPLSLLVRTNLYWR